MHTNTYLIQRQILYKNYGGNKVTACQGNYAITAKQIKKNTHPLYAPENGKMNRIFLKVLPAWHVTAFLAAEQEIKITIEFLLK